MPWQQTTPFVACTLAMSPEPLLCTAGVGLACLTVWLLHRRCFHVLYSCLLGRHRFLALDWWLLHERHSGLWTNHRCSLGLHLATGCRGSARLGWGAALGAAPGCRWRRARLGGLDFLQCRLLHGCRCLTRHLGCRKCRCRQWNRILLGLHLAKECIGGIQFDRLPWATLRATPEHRRRQVRRCWPP